MRKIRLMTILNQYLKIFDLEKIGWSCSDLFSTELDGTRTEIGSKKRYKFFRKFMEPNPDAREADMIVSEWDSKFLNGCRDRKTFTIENSSSQNM